MCSGACLGRNCTFSPTLTTKTVRFNLPDYWLLGICNKVQANLLRLARTSWIAPNELTVSAALSEKHTSILGSPGDCNWAHADSVLSATSRQQPPRTSQSSQHLSMHNGLAQVARCPGTQHNCQCIERMVSQASRHCKWGSRTYCRADKVLAQDGREQHQWGRMWTRADDNSDLGCPWSGHTHSTNGGDNWGNHPQA